MTSIINNINFNRSFISAITDMTISARLGRNYRGSCLERVVDWLFSWQGHEQGHCENADQWENDEGKDAIIAKNKNNKILT